MRIFALLPCQPFPPHNGQTHRLSLVLRALAKRNEVWLAGFVQEGDGAVPDADISGLFEAVTFTPVTEPGAGVLAAITRRLSPDPLDVTRFRSAAMRASVEAMLARVEPDVILLGDPALAQYLPPHRQAIVVLDYVCEVVLQLERMRDLAGGVDQLLWEARRRKYAAFLRRLGGAIDLVFLNSREDLASLARFWPAERLVHVPNGLVPDSYATGLAEPVAGRMIYAGSVLYPPNRDAIGWFTDTVSPAVRARVPGAELYVTGAHGPDPPRAEGLVYTGRLPDVHAAIAGAMISVVPLRLGAGGARFKVIESMALGTPVVATSIGVEGLELVDGVDYLRAETAEAIADACVALLTDRAQRERISASARRRIETDYNWARLSSEIETQIARRMDTLGRAA